MKNIISKTSKIIVARLERGEDLYNSLTRLVIENNVRSGCFQVIGGVKKGRLGVFINGDYEWTVQEGALEIASCIGNVAVKEGKPFIHCHAVLADHIGKVAAGHVGEGCIVEPTAEIHMQVYAGEISRRHQPDTGVWILDI